MNEAQLQKLYSRALAARRSANRADCPALEALLALVERDGPEEERLQTLDHVMACDACRGEFDMLRTVHTAGEQLAEHERSDQPRVLQFPRKASILALAAVLVLAVGVGTIWRQFSRGEDVLRGPASSLTLIAPSGLVTGGEALNLVWRPVPGAVGYDVELLDASGSLLSSHTTRDTLLEVGDLQPGGEYQWWVQSRLEDGTVRRSDTQRFQIERD